MEALIVQLTASHDWENSPFIKGQHRHNPQYKSMPLLQILLQWSIRVIGDTVVIALDGVA